MRYRIALMLVGSVGVCVATEASAQPPVAAQTAATEEDTVKPIAPPGTILAPSNAFELQFNAGYFQPFGELSDTVDMGDLADAGFTGGGALAWRLTPTYGVVGYGGFGHSVADDRLNDGGVFGGAGGVAASFHFLPYNLVDPVLQVGAGYRLMFVAPGDERDNHMFHGFQVLRTDFVLDFRTSDHFAIGPMISADINVLPWDLNTSTGTNSSVDEPRVSTFFFAGVAGRHDLLGSRVAKDGGKPVPAAGPRPAPAAGPAAVPAPKRD